MSRMSALLQAFGEYLAEEGLAPPSAAPRPAAASRHGAAAGGVASGQNGAGSGSQLLPVPEPAAQPAPKRQRREDAAATPDPAPGADDFIAFEHDTPPPAPPPSPPSSPRPFAHSDERGAAAAGMDHSRATPREVSGREAAQDRNGDAPRVAAGHGASVAVSAGAGAETPGSTPDATLGNGVQAEQMQTVEMEVRQRLAETGAVGWSDGAQLPDPTPEPNFTLLGVPRPAEGTWAAVLAAGPGDGLGFGSGLDASAPGGPAGLAHNGRPSSPERYATAAAAAEKGMRGHPGAEASEAAAVQALDGAAVADDVKSLLRCLPLLRRFKPCGRYMRSAAVSCEGTMSTLALNKWHLWVIQGLCFS